MAGPVSIPDAPPPARPVEVGVVGWTFLGLALLRILIDASTWIALRLGRTEAVVSVFLPRRDLAEEVVRGLGRALAIQAALAAGVAVVAWNLLRLRPWARRAMEILCWLGVAFVVTLGGFVAYVWSRGVTKEQASGSMAGAAVLAFLAFLFVMSLRALRRPHVRDAFVRGTEPGPEGG